jgi:RNA polymerase sigma-70 factor (ECF subfamily)
MKVERDFDEVYASYASAIYRFCLRAVSRPEVAEDLTSDVFLLYHENQHKLTGEQLPGWLFTVAKRRAADYWRHHYVEQRWSALQTEQPPTAADLEFSLEILLERCEALKPIHRTCLILRFRHGMLRAEIAAHTGLSELQVKGHLQYALHLLRIHIERPNAKTEASIHNAPRVRPAASDPRNETKKLRGENEILDA